MSGNSVLPLGTTYKDPAEFVELAAKAYAAVPRKLLPSDYSILVSSDLLRLTILLARYKFCARMLKRSDRVLDLGCGFGLGSMFLGQHCQSVLGVDLKEQAIEEAKAFNFSDNVEFVRQDLFSVARFPRYDVVSSIDVIEHFALDDGINLVDKIADLTAADGLAIIGTPSLYSTPYQGSFSKAGHIHCYDRDELMGIMEKRFARVLPFSMNDELVHTGHPQMAWYYFMLGICPNHKE